MSRSPIVSLFRFGRHELTLWRHWRMWSLLPRRKTYWHGELVHRSWLGLELVTDNRKDWFGDMAGTSEWAESQAKELPESTGGTE